MDFGRADGARIWQQGIDEAGNRIGVVTSDFLCGLGAMMWGLFVRVAVTGKTCARLVCAAFEVKKSSWGSRTKARDGASQA